uniref:AVL9/DENND6 domain-containing protein n=1 Tax=Tetranychus urticae TaxID=32264 RepID=T1L566_TETUR
MSLIFPSEVFLGLSPRDLIATFQHKILILFKLILLEKKVLFYKSPVKDLCTIILTLLSLFPGMIEEGGLDYSSTSVVPKPSSGRKFSGDIELLDPLIQEIDAKEKELNSSRSKLKSETIEDSAISDNTDREKDDELLLAEKEDCPNNKEEEEVSTEGITEGITEEIIEGIINQENESDEPDSSMITAKDKSEEVKIVTDSDDNKTEQIEVFDDIDNDVLNISHDDIEVKEDQSKDSQEHTGSSTPPLFKLPLSECGLPLRIFGNGSFCHPYLSITYLDILSDSRVRSCVVGATNFLFKQKRNLFDIIIEVDGAKIEINDPELRKRVTLSTEDLRFADYLVKAALEGQVINKNSNTVQLVPNDGSSWEGCDDWLRYQFKIYLLHLLRTSQCEENSKEYASFNSLFMASWKETYNYRLWSALSKPGIFEVNPGHPFHGQLSIADMKLKLSQAFSNTERGKKLNQTLGQTSKAVGGALSSAKTAVSSWWSSQWNSTNRARDVSPTNTSSYSLSGLLKSLDKNSSEEPAPKEDV